MKQIRVLREHNASPARRQVASVTKRPELEAHFLAMPAKERMLLADWFEELAAKCRGSKETPIKIPSGFVMVNMSAADQRELRNLSRECGLEFRLAMRHALLNMRAMLKQVAGIKRRTGLTWLEQDQALTCKGSLN